MEANYLSINNFRSNFSIFNQCSTAGHLDLATEILIYWSQRNYLIFYCFPIILLVPGDIVCCIGQPIDFNESDDVTA